MTARRKYLSTTLMKLAGLAVAGVLLGGCVMPYSYVQPNGGGGYYTAPAGYYSGQGAYYDDGGYAYDGAAYGYDGYGYGGYGYSGYATPGWTFSVGIGTGWPGYYGYGGWGWPGYYNGWYGGGWGGWGYPYWGWGGRRWRHHGHDGHHHGHHARPADYQAQRWSPQPTPAQGRSHEMNGRANVTAPVRAFATYPNGERRAMPNFVRAPVYSGRARPADVGFAAQRQQVWQDRAARPESAYAAPRVSGEWQAPRHAPTFHAGPAAAPRHFSAPAAPVMRIRDAAPSRGDPHRH